MQDERRAKIKSKMDELVTLLESSRLSEEEAHAYRERFNKALAKSTLDQYLKEYEQLDNPELSRMDMLNELGKLLNTTPVDNRYLKENRKKDWASGIVKLCIGVLLIILGYAMIILPAPPNFEMYTLFYFTPDDGVTIMDVISLLIVLTGIYITIISVKNKAA